MLEKSSNNQIHSANPSRNFYCFRTPLCVAQIYRHLHPESYELTQRNAACLQCRCDGIVIFSSSVMRPCLAPGCFGRRLHLMSRTARISDFGRAFPSMRDFTVYNVDVAILQFKNHAPPLTLTAQRPTIFPLSG